MFDAVRPWLAADRSLAALNAYAAKNDLKTASGCPVRFMPPGAQDAYYEVKVYETGRVETRIDNLHDYFNALAWLAFPRAKARLNALHAAEIARERGRRGRLRDLATIFDEGGAIVHCDDKALLFLLMNCQWQQLFWENREKVLASMRIAVFGHAVMEKALEPWPGITCKAIVVPLHADCDAATTAWLENLPPGASPRMLAPLPIFGFPGWHPGTARKQFYDDTRFFRPAAVKSRKESARQSLRTSVNEAAEESPGSAEQDAG